MSIKRKIFGVLGLLIVLALSIMAAGLYGMWRLESAIGEYIRLTDRTAALAEIDKIALQLTVAEKNLIIETDDAKLEEIANSDEFENFRPKLAAQLERVRQSQVDEAPQWVKDMPQQVETAAHAFDAETDEVARLTRLNTLQRALEESRANAAVWNEYDAVLTPVFLEVNRRWEGGDQGMAKAIVYMLSLKANRTTYQRDLQRLLTAQTAVERAELAKELRNSLKTIRELVLSAPKVFVGDLASRGGDIAAQEKAVTRAEASMEKIIDLAGQDSNGAAFRHSTTKVRDSRIAFDHLTSDIIKKSNEQLELIRRQTIALATALQRFMLIFSIGVIVAVGIIAYYVVNGITARLSRIIGELDSGADQVTSASREISAASQSLAEGATEQAASLEQTSSALEEMASMTRQNADNTTRTSKTTAQTEHLIGEGAQAVDNMSHAMNDINDSAEKIGNIIKTIEEIAFQTNLLALNAAVEAARAGEAGKGFAVVADEVRNLAQRSAQAARDTAALIGGTVTRVHHGAEIAATLAESFKEIETGAREVGKLIGDISIATNEQAQGVDQVNTAVAQMDKVTQQNAASAEECASASEELSAQADSLKSMVDDLVALMTGSRRRRREPEAAAPRRTVGSNAAHIARPAKLSPAAAPKRLSTASDGGQQVMTPREVIPLDGDGSDDGDF